jgi:hypothetical protein
MLSPFMMPGIVALIAWLYQWYEREVAGDDRKAEGFEMTERNDFGR